ncbi:MAG: polysaccharide deacetylase family protein [Gammaproteobacteria bacterium]|nr:polysaccharide deacetylase family protein [Gammaproteobacteria bacterium]
MYHRVGEAVNDWERKYCIAPDRFAAHMRILCRHGMRPCTIEDFVAWLSGKKTLGDKTFLLTFDDGFYGVYEHAMPVLAQLGWPATVFLVSSLTGKRDVWCEKENPSGRTYPLLGRDHIEEMRKHGFSFHSHSRTHADLTKTTDQDLKDELCRAKTELEDLLGTDVPYLAYPYGRYDERVVAVAREAGYRAAFSVQPGFNRPGLDPYRIRRLDVFGTDTPAQLRRKVMLGSNDGSLQHSLRYYAGQFAAKLGIGDRS